MTALRYGSESMQAALPADWTATFLELPAMPRPQDGALCIHDALDHPLSDVRLSSCAGEGDRVTLIVSDKTRLCAAETAVPIVLSRLHDAGVRKSDVTILFANGTHPRMSEADVARLLGRDIAAGYRVIQHDARDEAAMVHAGTTRFGTDVRLNRAAVECDHVVTIGTIVHHYFAGFGGGPKLFMPGVASNETAVQNHRRTLRDDGSFHPDCTDGNLDDNPVALDIRDAMRFFPPAYSLVVLMDAEGRVSDALAGPLADVHREGCARVDARCSVRIDAQADLVVVSAGGHPKDINFIQSHKALHHAWYAVRPGGAIICLAECAEGLGNETFLHWFGRGEDDLRRALRDEYTMNAHTAVALMEKTRACTVIFVSGLPDDAVRAMGMHPAHTWGDALAIAAGVLPARPHVHVIANGSLLVPRMRTR